jgi:hypothetical protein
MSSITLREWEVWTNDTFFATPTTLRGQFGFSIQPIRMANQTVEFIFEVIERMRARSATVTGTASFYLLPLAYPSADARAAS